MGLIPEQLHVHDKRIEPLFEPTVVRIGKAMTRALQNNGLLDSDGEPTGLLTQSGLDELAKCYGDAMLMQFNNMKITAPPLLIMEETSLEDQMVNNTGDPTVQLTDHGTMVLSFTGDRPLIQQIEIPLDANNAQTLSEKDGVKQIARVYLGPFQVIDWGGFISSPPTVDKQTGIL